MKEEHEIRRSDSRAGAFTRKRRALTAMAYRIVSSVETRRIQTFCPGIPKFEGYKHDSFTHYQQ